MKNRFPTRTAAIALFVILSLMVLFHLLVLTGLVPYGSVWGGRLRSYGQMVRFEAVAISVNLLLLAVVRAAAGGWGRRVPRLLLRAALWLMTGLFLLNTVGNLLAHTTLERLVFTPLTLLLALCSLRLALGSPAAAPAPDSRL
ncbi:hypothetical protein [Hymenobacter chitinivorans]|uniref:Uncharacterized protein n=1 Tax=Hymenobacter chitinivorans DSM 11115 TaxID=1121954 RepID=A0A2M9BPJ9_9BACT|nr:hypothetical protein [Hymenobacter chitinivorans]PJJ59857.1 hypothetical protein CLV45_1279 [Hymenobacter chitinivorans DSM 11115]